MALKWPHSTYAAITLATGDMNFFWMAFLLFPKRGFDSHPRSFLPGGWRDCRVVFPSWWEASEQHYMIREIIRELWAILFVLVKEDGAEGVWSYLAAFRTCQDNIWMCPKEGVLHCHLQASSLTQDPSVSNLFCFQKPMWTYCCQTPGSYFVFLMSSFVLCPFSLQINLPRWCKSPSLGCSCHWGLPSVSPSSSDLMATSSQACGQPCTGRASCSTPAEHPWHVPFRCQLCWWWARGGQISFASPLCSSSPSSSWLPAQSGYSCMFTLTGDPRGLQGVLKSGFPPAPS